MAGNMIGRIFNNRYKITDRIGIGGMAEVYRAQDTVLGRTVAVKVMLPQYAADQSFTHRFRQEAAAAANLQSPYIVNVYDWGQDSGTYYIVMEYVRGSDLKTAIKERGAINQRKVAEIGSQVCQALSVAHNLDIIHRDIKPQNIMIQPDGNVKVMDFGIARAKNSVMTQTSSVLGTAHYVSPEQAQGKELTYASDIYSLGIVLYEAATGKLPFDGPDAVSVAMKQVQEYPVPPSQINPEIDPALEDIIMKALDKNPDNRFATAREMKHALNDYLSGRSVNLNGFGSAETHVMNNVPVVPPIDAAGGTAVMPAVNGANASSPVQGGYRNTNTAPKKSKAGLVIALVVAVVAIAAIAIGLTQCTGTSGEAVPNVVNMEQEAAEQAIKDAGFTVGSVSTAKSDSVEEGKVISQDPAAGSKREKGSKVNLVVSGGEDQIEVPDVKGETESDAKKTLEALGLTVTTQEEYSSDVEEGKVVSQDPSAKSKAKKGDTVTLVISKGAESIDIPDLSGMSESSARSALSKAGLSASIQTAYSDSVDKGYVISWSPTSQAEKGDTVTVVISNGPDPSTQEITVPSVVGWSVSEATLALQNTGFDVYVTGYSSSDGIVTSQSATSAKKGSTITLTAKAPSTQGGGGSSTGDGGSGDSPSGGSGSDSGSQGGSDGSTASTSQN